MTGFSFSFKYFFLFDHLINAGTLSNNREQTVIKPCIRGMKMEEDKGNCKKRPDREVTVPAPTHYKFSPNILISLMIYFVPDIPVTDTTISIFALDCKLVLRYCLCVGC